MLVENYNIISCKDKLLWDKTLDAFSPQLRDLYNTSDYYAVCQNQSNSNVKCFIYKDNGDTFFYPFLLTDIPNAYTKSEIKYFDIEGTYGYNGALTTGSTGQFLERVKNTFLSYCSENNIIAEFTRFNPVIKNHLWQQYLNPVKVNENVILELTMENIWMNAYEQSARKNIKKAERSELQTFHVFGENISVTDMSIFLDIYYSTMKRNNAKESYYFSESFFSDISRLPQQSAIFFFTRKDDKILSCELVLVGREIGYSFLGGTLPEYFSLRANDILKHYIINTLKILGYKYFCLGGGTSLNDGIFNYKKCFAKNGIQDFYIGKKIHNQKMYDTVIKNWTEMYPEKDVIYKNHLLKYKY